MNISEIIVVTRLLGGGIFWHFRAHFIVNSQKECGSKEFRNGSVYSKDNVEKRSVFFDDSGYRPTRVSTPLTDESRMLPGKSWESKNIANCGNFLVANCWFKLFRNVGNLLQRDVY